MAKRGPKGPSRYTQEFISAKAVQLLEYAQDCMDKKIPMLLERFCALQRIPSQVVSTFAQEKSSYYNQEFHEALMTFKDFQKSDFIEGAVTGRYNGVSTIFTLKNVSDMRDEQFIKDDRLKPVFNIHISPQISTREGNRLIGHNSKASTS